MSHIYSKRKTLKAHTVTNIHMIMRVNRKIKFVNTNNSLHPPLGQTRKRD